MQPPQLRQFASRNELLEYMRSFSKTQGYAVTIKRSCSDRNGKIKNVVLGCDRSGFYRNRLNLSDDLHHKRTASRLINCPFELFGTRHDNIWHLEVRNSEHNHEASTDMSGHPIVRKLNVDQKELVKQMVVAGSRPRQILSTIHQNDLSLFAISRTIYNIMNSIRQERLDGHTPVQAFLDKLQGSDFEFEYRVGAPKDCITDRIPDKRNPCSNLFSLHDKLIKVSSATPDSPLKPCTETFKSTMGLPCHHIEFLESTYIIKDNCTNLQPLLQSLAHMYQFWPPHQQVAIHSQLEELVNTPPVVVENPVTSKPRGRPVGARNKNKRIIQRDPSTFEHVEKQSRQCGTCHQTGHNKRANQ
ncbi:7103_t:CDS:2 [Cetraspora pellucida]|uniref:7103_t:CDS:1 n=1 Tax=Cetraspora pellucida TaxID=1433469 RepID=A0A9N9F5G3_9GLOM|nr:7103_t:CDS:2 [Cetraspora pellucida]